MNQNQYNSYTWILDGRGYERFFLSCQEQFKDVHEVCEKRVDYFCEMILIDCKLLKALFYETVDSESQHWTKLSYFWY